MTILDAWITPELALIGTDSQITDGSGGFTKTTKLYPLLHLNALMSGRGSAVFIMTMFTYCNVSKCSNFDALLEAMPDALPMMFNQTLEQMAAMGATDTDKGDAQAILLAGWSDKHGRMIGRQFTQERREVGFVAADFEHYAAPGVAPGLGEMSSLSARLPDFSTAESMARLAARQVQLMREKAPVAAAGGPFMVARLTRHEITIGAVCDLDAVEDPEVRTFTLEELRGGST